MVTVNIPKLPNVEGLIPTRQSLLSRLKDYDDNESWRDFFHTYWKLIYSMAIRSGLSETEAQEVVQETIIAVSKQMPDFKYDRAKGSFKSWLLQLTRWKIQDQLRRRQRDEHLAGGPETIPSGEVENIPDPSTADSPWEDEWQKNLVEAALQRLKVQAKPKQFQIFDLYVMKQWPIARVTATLGVNFGQVYMAKHRLTAMLKKEIKILEARF